MYLSNDELLRLERLSDLCDPPPWIAMVEGRDHESGDSFIQVNQDDDRREDLYVSRDSAPADNAILDLIAAARTDLPILLAEIRDTRSRASRDG